MFVLLKNIPRAFRGYLQIQLAPSTRIYAHVRPGTGSPCPEPEPVAKKSHAAAEESDGSDSCGQRQGNKAPKKNRKGKGDDSDSSSNDSASSKRRQHKKVHKKNRKSNDPVSNNSDSSDSGDQPPVRKRKGKDKEVEKARKTILVGGEKKRRWVSQREEPVIQLRPPFSGAAALSPESVSDNMRLARMQAEEVHSAQARQRQRVSEIAALKAKAEAKRGRSLW